MLRNTKYAYGIAIYTGHDSKLMKNARYKHKQTNLIISQQSSSQANQRRKSYEFADSVHVLLAVVHGFYFCYW